MTNTCNVVLLFGQDLDRGDLSNRPWTLFSMSAALTRSAASATCHFLSCYHIEACSGFFERLNRVASEPNCYNKHPAILG